MSQDEITVMNGSKCFFQLKCNYSYLQYNLIYKAQIVNYLKDYNMNTFDIVSYINQKGIF